MRLILLILLSVCYADVIHVPADYSTIQEGIDAAAQDDIVVVSPATYQENIVIDKTLTLTSLALFNTETETIIDSLDTWFDWGTTQYDITNDSILTTIIDGSQPVNDSLGSTILIKAADDDCISPKILGFTITGGKGTLIDRSYVDPETGDTTYTPQHLGGGLFSYVTTPDIRYNYFYNNGSLDIEEGGAVYAVSDPDDCPFPTRSRCEIDEIDFSHNFFRDNTSRLGKILANRFFEDEVKLSNCVFDYYCEATGNPNMYWVKVDEPEEVDYEETTSDQCPIDWDVWVSPNGSDDGEGSESQPFQTIGLALSVVVGTEDNPVTINLTEGTFSPSTTGESFSINMVSNVNLIGQGEEITILDAEQTDRVITMEYCQNNIVSDLTITGGNTEDSGGGMYLYTSNPTLSHVTISGNYAGYGGGGMRLYDSNPTLTHMTISGNTADGNGGGMSINISNPTLTHVTISGNTVVSWPNGLGTWWGSGMFLYDSNPTLTYVTITENTEETETVSEMALAFSNPTLINSIIWNNNQPSIWSLNEIGEPIITYSDIQGGWEGEGNIDADPLFYGDYTLMDGSPCIDAGDPNLWYQDIDGTRADMGATGGLFALPNFISYGFGEVGDFGSNKQFTLYNYRQTPITISGVNFNTFSFTTNSSFPITIPPLQAGIINIEANNSSFEFVQDEMELVSEELPEGISVSLSVTGAEGNVLTGNLSGTYPAAIYRISGDLTIASDDTVYLQPGTEFLFDGEYNFTVYGTLKAIGTETDSIIFGNYLVVGVPLTDKWKGFTLDGASDETVFKYVRVSGAENEFQYGGGMYLSYTNPTLTHVTISENTGSWGWGMDLDYSNPILTHVTIADNTRGMSLNSSNPILTHVIITGNTAGGNAGGGMRLSSSNPTLTHVTISGNTTNSFGGGMWLHSSNPVLTHVIITGNSADEEGGGIYLRTSNPSLTHVTISGNTSDLSGGGMFLSENSDPTLTHVAMTGNTANHSGGGMLVWDSNPTLTQVTITGNMASSGGGMRLSSSNPTLINSIIWDNSPESISLETGNEEPIITYCDIEGGWEGEGNIDVDPIFISPNLIEECLADPNSENFEDLSLYCSILNFDECMMAIYYNECESWVFGFQLHPDSPCIDAGIELEGMEYCGTAPDMGAYEYFTEDCLGCTDEIACNYDDTVIQDDGSCEYPEEGFDCDGNELSMELTEIPDHYSITNIYPNPFNPTTTISFSIPEPAHTTITAYTLMGRELETLTNEVLNAGYHTINWNASYYPSGVYLIRMESGSFTQTQKVVLVK